MKIWNEDSKRSPDVGDIIMYDWDNQDGWPETCRKLLKVSQIIKLQLLKVIKVML